MIATTLLLSLLVQPLEFIKIKSLKGYFIVPEDSVLNRESWFSGSYQSSKEERLKYTLKTRPLLVRTYNQIRFWLYKEISARNVAIGRNGYYYEKHYIGAYFGLDFIGEDSIINKISELQRLSNILNSKGVSLMFVLAPGKATVFPEYMPEEFDNYKRKTTNYEIFRRELHKSSIPFIDFNQYFKEIKDTVTYPIYPKGGTHWSNYGTYIALDTLFTYIEFLTHKDLPEYRYFAFDVSKTPRGSDNDIAKATNRIWIKENEKLLYPFITITDTQNKEKPCLLTIADSYYWMIVGTGVLKKFFSNFNFWYYFKENFSPMTNKPQFVSEYPDLLAEVEKRDVIILLITDGNLNEFSWGFTEKILELYDHQAQGMQ
ncbi:MAG: hypothetical protein ISR55_08515 [Bacteroidetes bacterium]|nr:hypothetical protein [Bacteroidota bacterium]